MLYPQGGRGLIARGRRRRPLQIGHVFPLQAVAKTPGADEDLPVPASPWMPTNLPVPPLSLFQQRWEDLQFALPPHKGGQALRCGHRRCGCAGLVGQ